MPESPHADQHAHLKPDDLARFLNWLSPDKAKQTDALVQLQGDLHRFFAGGGCKDDSASLVSETLLRLLRQFVNGREPKIETTWRKYVFGIATNVRALWYAGKQRFPQQSEPLDDETLSELLRRAGFPWQQGQGSRPPWVPPSQRLICAERCVARLPAADQRLFHDYHFECEDSADRAQLAQREGINLNYLRVRIHKILHTILVCVAECSASGPRPGDNRWQKKQTAFR